MGAVLHATFKVAQRLTRGDVVLLFAGDGWKHLATNLWTSPAPAGEGEVLRCAE